MYKIGVDKKAYLNNMSERIFVFSFLTMCLQHTHLASATGTSLPPAPLEISELPASQRKVKGLIDKIV